MLRKLVGAFIVLAAPGAVHAEWREATSKNFLVYSESSEAQLRQFVANLEKYDFLLRAVTNTRGAPNGNKLTIYLLPSAAAVSRAIGGFGIAGYYSYGPRGAYFVGINNNKGDVDDLKGQTVLLHEYTHHFMFQYSPATYPAWYSEGFAEYYGTAKFMDNDVIEVGAPAEHRYGSFQDNRWLPVGKLLAARNYAEIGPDIDLLYAEGWLLVHYLSFNKERAGQLSAYLGDINKGVSYPEAANAAFGEGAKKLNAELQDYAFRRKLSALRLPFKEIDTGTITIRSLRPGEQAMMSYNIDLSNGISVNEAKDFAGTISSLAAKYPQESAVLYALIEAERAAGDLPAAAEAADKFLAVQPGSARGLMHKAAIAIDRLAAAGSTDAKAWEAARNDLIAAHKRDMNDPIILEAYYDSFGAQGMTPPVGAQNGLYRAHELAPQDEDLSYKLAADFESRGMIEDALAVIRPVALALPDREESQKEKERREKKWAKYHLAGDTLHETAREMMVRLEKALPAQDEKAKAPESDG